MLTYNSSLIEKSPEKQLAIIPYHCYMNCHCDFDRKYKEGQNKMAKQNVTRKELAIAISEKIGASQRSSGEIVDTVFSVIKKTLITGVKWTQLSRQSFPKIR